MKHFVTFMAACCLTMSMQAANYYCAPEGVGSGNSVDNPCTLRSGVSKLSSPGDTLFLLDGVYYEDSKLSISKTGSVDKNICIFAYPGAHPVIDFRNQPYGSSNRGVSIGSASAYLHLRGLTIRYAGDNGLYTEGSYCTIEQCEFYGNCDTGLQLKVGHDNRIINCDSHDNFDYQTGSTASADFGGNADGFADKQYDNQGGNYFYGCRAWNNSDDGWDFFQHVSHGSQTVLEHCICYNNGPAAYDMTNHPRYQTDYAWFKQFEGSGMDVGDSDSKTGGTKRVTISNYVNWGNGNGFKLGGGMTNHNVQVQFCLAVANTVRGYDQNNNAGEMRLYNNSGMMNNPDFGFGNSSYGTLVCRNNVSYASQKSNDLKSLKTTHDHNSWDTEGLNCTAADFCSLDTSLILAPRQADGELSDNLFMRLADGSRLVDAGVSVGLPYSGAAPDLGCYESGNMDNFPGAVNCITENATQSVVVGQDVQTIRLRWSGGATGIELSGMPEGMSAVTDEQSKTVSIGGSPVTPGIYTITATTTGGAGEPAVITLTISAKSAAAARVALVTIPDSEADRPMFEHLNACMDMNITQTDASDDRTDYAGYDMIIISAVPNSTAAGLLALKGVDKPVLLMKPFLLKNTAWNWGNAVNSTDLAVHVLAPEHAVFRGLPLTTDNQLVLFGKNDRYAVTYIDQWYDASATLLAEPVSASGGWAVAEMPTGSVMNGTMLTHTMLMIGMSEYSSAHATDAANRLVENACRYLLDMPIQSRLEEISRDAQIERHGDNLYLTVNGRKADVVRLCDASGRLVQTAVDGVIHLAGLEHGVYLLCGAGRVFKVFR